MNIAAHLKSQETYDASVREAKQHGAPPTDYDVTYEEMIGNAALSSVGQSLHLRYRLLDIPVLVATIDLGREWQDIEVELNSLVDECASSAGVKHNKWQRTRRVRWLPIESSAARAAVGRRLKYRIATRYAVADLRSRECPDRSLDY